MPASTATKPASTTIEPTSAATQPPATATQPPATATSSGAFTDEQLAKICQEATESAFGGGVVFDLAGTRIELREVDPEWLVLVPVQADTYRGEAQCTIGGTATDPIVEMSSGSLYPLPEVQIQNLIRGENEGGTE